MFRSFFNALRQLTANVEALAASFAEANERFRANLALDHDDTPTLPPPVEEDGQARRNGRRVKV